jgi:hypothetical protein
VELESGQKLRVEQLRRGDSVRNSRGKTATIVCVIRTQVRNNAAWLVRRGEMLVTPYHPILIRSPEMQSMWRFPIEVGPPELVDIDTLYNFVLDDPSCPITVSGQDAITLGHGITADPVLKHPYFGTEAVLRDVSSHPGWTHGLINLAPVPSFLNARPLNETPLGQEERLRWLEKRHMHRPAAWLLQIARHVDRVLEDSRFRRDADGYMKEWAAKRGSSEEWRVPEDPARELVDHLLSSRPPIK